MEEFIRLIKEEVTTSVKRNTKRGFIGWSSCDRICMDMHKCIDKCEDVFKKGNYILALEGALYIYVRGIKLASCADSSSGMLTDVIQTAYDFIEKCVAAISDNEKNMQDKAFSMIMRESKKKAFDGWNDNRYDLLKCAICLSDEKSAKKLDNMLDVLKENIKESIYTKFYEDSNKTLKYLLHRHLKGKAETKEELYNNLNVNELCLIAIEDAMEINNFAEAERLCKDKIPSENSRMYRSYDPKDWNNILFSIYEKSGDKVQKAVQARNLLLLGNTEMWDVLKQIYTDMGQWEEQRELLFDDLKNGNQLLCYRNILFRENEKGRLLQSIQSVPSELFRYGEYLATEYPNQVYELCRNDIVKNLSYANNRKEYKRLTNKISQLIKWNGKDVAKSLILELKEKYRQRPAFIDELKKVEALI